MVSDGVIYVYNTKPNELSTIHRMEQDTDTAEFIVPYRLARHESEYAKDNVYYKSIYGPPGELIGFAILALNDNGTTMEFRRLMISEKGKGFGSRAVALMDTVAKEEFHCRRIWLDVFEFNTRGQHVYTKLGYVFQSRTEYQGRVLRVYDKQPDVG